MPAFLLKKCQLFPIMPPNGFMQIKRWHLNKISRTTQPMSPQRKIYRLMLLLTHVNSRERLPLTPHFDTGQYACMPIVTPSREKAKYARKN